MRRGARRIDVGPARLVQLPQLWQRCRRRRRCRCRRRRRRQQEQRGRRTRAPSTCEAAQGADVPAAASMQRGVQAVVFATGTRPDRTVRLLLLLLLPPPLLPRIVSGHPYGNAGSSVAVGAPPCAKPATTRCVPGASTQLGAHTAGGVAGGVARAAACAVAAVATARAASTQACSDGSATAVPPGAGRKSTRGGGGTPITARAPSRAKAVGIVLNSKKVVKKKCEREARAMKSARSMRRRHCRGEARSAHLALVPRGRWVCERRGFGCRGQLWS